MTAGREPPAAAVRRRPRGSDVRIVIAAMPKSGSTWLRLILQSYTKMPRANLAPASPRREQEIDPIYGRGFAGGFVASTTSGRTASRNTRCGSCAPRPWSCCGTFTTIC